MENPTSVALHIDRPPGSCLCGYRPRPTEPTEPVPYNLTGPEQRVNPTQRCPEEKKGSEQERGKDRQKTKFKRLVRAKKKEGTNTMLKKLLQKVLVDHVNHVNFWFDSGWEPL